MSGLVESTSPALTRWDRSSLEALKNENEQLNRELSDLRRQMQQNVKFISLGKIAGMLAHEIASPLDGTIRTVSLAAQKADGHPEVKEYLNDTHDGLKRIAGTIRSILDYSWALSQTNGFTDVNRLIENSLTLFEDKFHSSNIRIQRNLTRDLPPVKADGMEFVLNNLIKNAWQIMPEGGELIVSSSRCLEEVKIVVSDSGPGIPLGYEERIFEPFFTTKAKGKGSGLGLAIVRDIVEQTGGRIMARNNDDKGASFILTLPVAPNTNLPEEPELEILNIQSILK